MIYKLRKERIIMKKILISGLLALSVLAVGCSNAGTTTTEPISNSNANATEASNKEFTLDELKKYDGKNSNKAYVAVDGVVYDVTNVDAWKNGEHKNGLTAGNDLSEEINKSPHGKDVLEELPVVGKIK